MDNKAQTIFLTEVLKQCDFALMGYVGVLEALEKMKDREVGRLLLQMNRLWYSMQCLLVAAGNVSKLLWPTATRSESRGKGLREVLGVPGDSPVASRSFRNHFEHFDERLEAWINRSEGMFVDSNVGPMTKVTAGGDSSSYLRNYDDTTEILTFKGDSLELRPLVDGISRIRDACAVALEQTHWPVSPRAAM